MVGVYEKPEARILDDLRAHGFEQIAVAPPYVLMLRK